MRAAKEAGLIDNIRFGAKKGRKHRSREEREQAAAVARGDLLSTVAIGRTPGLEGGALPIEVAKRVYRICRRRRPGLIAASART
jgi:hypothetical protein